MKNLIDREFRGIMLKTIKKVFNHDQKTNRLQSFCYFHDSLKFAIDWIFHIRKTNLMKTQRRRVTPRHWYDAILPLIWFSDIFIQIKAKLGKFVRSLGVFHNFSFSETVLTKRKAPSRNDFQIFFCGLSFWESRWCGGSVDISNWMLIL
jgi:hypothetical protein